MKPLLLSLAILMATILSAQQTSLYDSLPGTPIEIQYTSLGRFSSSNGFTSLYVDVELKTLINMRDTTQREYFVRISQADPNSAISYTNVTNLTRDEANALADFISIIVPRMNRGAPEVHTELRYTIRDDVSYTAFTTGNRRRWETLFRTGIYERNKIYIGLQAIGNFRAAIQRGVLQIDAAMSQ